MDDLERSISSPEFVRQLKRSRTCPHTADPMQPGTEELDALLGSYVIVSHDDAVNAMACYIAAWLSNVPEAQQLEPAQLQQAVLQGVKVRSAHDAAFYGLFAGHCSECVLAHRHTR